MQEISATAPGKIILFGEHAVVYGQPAIAVPVSDVRTRAVVRAGRPGMGLLIIAANLARTIVVFPEEQPGDHALAIAARLLLARLDVPLPDFEVLLHSTIPVASGLGSGAAATTALLRALSAALARPLSPEVLNEMVYEIEKLHHGTPSGIDNTVVVYEKPVYFIRDRTIEPFAIGASLDLVVADTGSASPTHITVGDVREMYQAEPGRIGAIFERIGAIVRDARGAIEQGDRAALGSLMRANHALLRELNVSSEQLDGLAVAAESAGAYGAKLSGGGRGGNLITLVAPEHAERVAKALEAAGAKRAFHTTLR
jgi:mevalonate kinase